MIFLIHLFFFDPIRRILRILVLFIKEAQQRTFTSLNIKIKTLTKFQNYKFYFQGDIIISAFIILAIFVKFCSHEFTILHTKTI